MSILKRFSITQFQKNRYKKALEEYNTIRENINIFALKPAKGYLRKYQIQILDFAKMWFKIFDELDIQYFLIAGNLLGAYRHKGFIPWDDDFDIGMMREDYEKTIKYLRENCVEIDVGDICINSRNKYILMNKSLKKYRNKILFMKCPTHIQIFTGKSIKKLSLLEIFPYDYYNDNIVLSDMQKLAVETRNKIYKLKKFSLIEEYFNQLSKNTSLISRNSNTIYYGIDNCDLVGIPCKELLFKEDIYPIKKVEFEGELFNVPNNVEKHLRMNYGEDFLKIPEEIVLDLHLNRISKNGESSLDNLSIEKKVVIKKIRKKFMIKALKYRGRYIVYKRILKFLKEII